MKHWPYGVRGLNPAGEGYKGGCLTDGGFLKWWVSPTTMGFPTKNDHFGVF